MSQTDGEILAELIEKRAENSVVKTRRASCLMGCTHGCNVTIQANGKLAYTVGNFTPDADAANAVVSYAESHAQSQNGQVPYRGLAAGHKGPFCHPASTIARRPLSLEMKRYHGGGVDAAIAKYGGVKSDWVDLSTGINPNPYLIREIPSASWKSLPDHGVITRLENTARKFWNIPDSAAVLAAPGASSLIARIPALVNTGAVSIPGPTYNEHAAAFSAQGWSLNTDNYSAKVLVHPNNPDGRYWHDVEPGQKLTIIDESFCDVAPARSLVNLSTTPGTLILKSFGKFWGLAGLRLGFRNRGPGFGGKTGGTTWPLASIWARTKYRYQGPK